MGYIVTISILVVIIIWMLMFNSLDKELLEDEIKALNWKKEILESALKGQRDQINSLNDKVGYLKEENKKLNLKLRKWKSTQR